MSEVPTEGAGPFSRAFVWLAERLRASGPTLREKLLPQLVGLLPAAFLIVFLRRLSGSALWVPLEWRHLVDVLGLTLGLASFNLARARGPAQDAATLLSSNPQLGDLRGAERAQELEGLKRGVLLLIATATFMVGYQYLSGRSVVTFRPQDAWVTDNLESLADSPVVTAEEVSTHLGADFLDVRRSGDVWVVKALLPLSPSQRFRDLVLLYEKSHAGYGEAAFGQGNTSEFIDLLGDEKERIKVTAGLFLFLLLAAICSASAGFGLAYDFGEEALDLLFGSVLG